MLVIFDGRAQSVPLWLAASGFSLWEGVEVAGAQYRIPYVYKVTFIFVQSPKISRRLSVVVVVEKSLLTVICVFAVNFFWAFWRR